VRERACRLSPPRVLARVSLARLERFDLLSAIALAA
jgi:hypothetical protein